MIQAHHLQKQYRIGAVRQKHPTLRDRLSELVRSPLDGIRRAPSSDYFFAIDDVSFEIQPGEVVGVIGRNGAGKSTLLKLLARITEPTSGFAQIRGRVASLLEVGTGFHPELSGRENIFLNGAILGMPRHETARKFDEIVEFGEVARFIDTAVKHYSSGMYLRLAFAVAAHLEPDILLVDEVLAVGDASFQRKCLSKMEDVSTEGRTVLFISHNMSAVTRLCPRTILLNKGRVQADGKSGQVVSVYLNSGLGTSAAREWPDPLDAPGNAVCRIRSVRCVNSAGHIVDAPKISEPLFIEMHWDVLQDGWELIPNFHFYNDEGVCAFTTQDLDPNWRRRKRMPGRYVTRVEIPANFLADGTLLVGAAISTMDPLTVHVYEREAIAFQVVDSVHGDTARGDYMQTIPGVVRPLLSWTNEFQGVDCLCAARGSDMALRNLVG